jgi:predicted transcriptional regulator
MMGILERKRHLKKKAGERAYIYRPTRPQDEVVQSMVADFVGRVFDGSAKNLMVHLVEDRETPPEDLDEIEALVRERRRRRP